MYCQKCNRLLSEDNLKCTKCGFDNSIVSKSIKLKETNVVNKKLNPITVIIGIIILMIISFAITIIIMNNNKKEEYEYNTVTKEVVLNNKFTFKGITIDYPDTWGSSKTAIFNRESQKVNITFKEINETDYNELTSINECLKHSFKDFTGLTYAEESLYTYLFVLDGTYYKITVNYEKTSYTEEMQNEISQIINSITQKK
ncbi:MAG: hypothetical protein K6E99_04705 [Bacilli bacterium]|nr:hypothetical protein [Bacilli bacterium]